MTAVRPLLAVCIATWAGALVLLAGGAPAAAATDPAPDQPGGIDIGVTVPVAEDADGTDISNAELRWGLNAEASSGAFAGGCNFLSAGTAGDAGDAHVWTAAENLYSAQSGNVTIVKPTANAGWEPASFDTKCLDASGSAVTANSLTSTTQSQVAIDGGTGIVLADGGLRLDWSGSFTVVFYGGMTYWSASDPELVLDADGNGQLTATASGYGTSMDDMTQWVELAPRTIVLAELRGVAIGEAGGFTHTPEYLGVTTANAGQVAPSAQNAAHWGAFPASFIEFQKLTGQTGYWLSTGGQRDPAKPAGLLTVNFNADAPAFVPAAEGGLESSVAPENPVNLRQVAASAPGQDGLTIAGIPVALSRDAGEGLVPDAVRRALSPLVLPLGGAALALLVSVLTWLQLTGRLVLPWTAPKLPGGGAPPAA
ncbi:MAG: hypothetical protein ABWY68_08720 [Cryobacterium sp.]